MKPTPASSTRKSWRTLKVGGQLNPKIPGGLREDARRLQKEAHTITPNLVAA